MDRPELAKTAANYVPLSPVSYIARAAKCHPAVARARNVFHTQVKCGRLAPVDRKFGIACRATPLRRRKIDEGKFDGALELVSELRREKHVREMRVDACRAGPGCQCAALERGDDPGLGLVYRRCHRCPTQPNARSR